MNPPTWKAITKFMRREMVAIFPGGQTYWPKRFWLTGPFSFFLMRRGRFPVSLEDCLEKSWRFAKDRGETRFPGTILVAPNPKDPKGDPRARVYLRYADWHERERYRITLQTKIRRQDKKIEQLKGEKAKLLNEIHQGLEANRLLHHRIEMLKAQCQPDRDSDTQTNSGVRPS